VTASGHYGVSCSAGSDLLAFRIDCVARCIVEVGRINVPHAGLSEVAIREDGRIFASAGWDHRYDEQNTIDACEHAATMGSTRASMMRY
jgi:hypothetical protein